MNFRKRFFDSRSLQSGVLLLILIFAAYFPTFQNGFIWDDDKYLTDNPLLRDWEGLKNIWFNLTASPPNIIPWYSPLFGLKISFGG